MKKSKYIGIMMLAAGMLTAASCSDFDDYNKAVTDAAQPSANQTLWENIQQNPQLSDFASLVQKAGFDDELNTTHYYTVWAPLNGSFDTSAYQDMKTDQLMRLFVKNHIADYGYNATGTLNQRVQMLNEKSYYFTGNANYQFDGVNIAQANLPSSNGVMHTLQGVAEFYPNLYEYVTDSTLTVGKELDSLRHYFQRYETTYLDEKRSVVGPIVDGLQTYVDSVMVTENVLWDMLNVAMTAEDSSYTFLMPTNDAWTKTYNRIKDYYKYIPTTEVEQFVKNADGSVDLESGLTRTIDAAYWQDSMVTRRLTNYLVYSNSDPYNQELIGKASPYGPDTLRTTTFSKLSNRKDIVAATTEEVKMSNGVARIVDSLAMYPWETYAFERNLSATGNLARVTTAGNAFNVRVENPDPAKVQLEDGATSFTYVWAQPTGGYATPELDFYLPNVLSTTYDIYCVFVPATMSPATDASAYLPNRVIFTLSYCDANGFLQNKVFLDEREENIKSFQERFKLSESTERNRNTIRAFSNDTSKVDTVYVGEFTFPVCYYGLGDGYCPNLKVSTPWTATTRALREAFSRDLRIAAIILRPKELVEFEESNK